jgi:hypothetical protein
MTTMGLPSLTIPPAARLRVDLTGGPVPHPTAGYRDWNGRFESTEAIVALALVVSDGTAHWARTSHRSTEVVESRILLGPLDPSGRRVQAHFGLNDVSVHATTVVEPSRAQPEVEPGPFVTGELLTVARVAGDSPCELMALFLARRDVVSVRNGLWHAKDGVAAGLDDRWRTVLTHGRTGHFDVT